MWHFGANVGHQILMFWVRPQLPACAGECTAFSKGLSTLYQAGTPLSSICRILRDIPSDNWIQKIHHKDWMQSKLLLLVQNFQIRTPMRHFNISTCLGLQGPGRNPPTLSISEKKKNTFKHSGCRPMQTCCQVNMRSIGLQIIHSLPGLLPST